MIRVAVIEDDRNIREGLRLLIAGTPGFIVSGVYSSMEEALSGMPAALPQVALIDLELPGMSGIEGMRRLKESHLAVQLLVLTIYDDDDRIFHAMCAGACGYLLKKTPPARLLESIQEVASGGSCISPEVARRIVELFRSIAPSDGSEYHLTPHELRLLRLLVQGHNYKTAAAELEVSVNTISFHVRKIYEKLHVHSKSQAVAKAIKSGIV
jgi:DNA-binding NarL/FixJ family response regulator